MITDVIIDTKLLVLLVVGGADRNYISQHKRLRPYTEADFVLLTGLISQVSKILATSNTLTETSNFLGYIEEPARTRIYEFFRKIFANIEERYLESKQSMQRVEFPRLGLTDSTILCVAGSLSALLTDDLDLYLAASRQGYNVINFTHYRAAHL